MKTLLLAVVTIAMTLLSTAFAQGPQPLSLAGGAGLIRVQGGDRCTDQYANCVDSCSRQRTQCGDRGSGNSYCDSGYRQCSNSCERSMKVCSNKDRWQR